MLSSILAWWLLWRELSPRAQFASCVCHGQRNLSEGDYRVKFRNNGRRGMMDVEFYALLFIPGTVPHDQTHPLITIPMLEARYPVVGGRRGRARNGTYLLGHRTLVLRPDLIVGHQLDRIPTPHRAALATRAPAALATLLETYTGASVHVACIASDAVTGARRAFLSPNYTRSEFVEGRFQAGRSLEVIPAREDRSTDQTGLG